MFRKLTLLMMALFFSATVTLSAQYGADHTTVEGYYRDALVNSGPGVSTTEVNTHLDELGWGYDFLGLGLSLADQDRFFELIAGREADRNGLLLYPDGAPRYRIMAVGKAVQRNGKFQGGLMGTILDGTHPFLNQPANVNLIDFVENGAGYIGFCAGMQLMDDFRIMPLGVQTYLYPPNPFTGASKFNGKYTSLGVTLDSVLQWGGTYVSNPDHVPGLEEIATARVVWDLGHRRFGATWRYQDPQDADKGRLLFSGFHPEMNSEQAAIDLVTGYFTWAAAANAPAPIKATLANGATHVVDQETFSTQWNRIKIGDGQYHHYRIQPSSSNRGPYLRVTVTGEAGANLHLFLNQGGPAFKGASVVEDITDGDRKVLTFDALTYGDWYLAVKGADLPDEYYIQNDQGIDVLNGLGYSIHAEWSSQPFCLESSVTNLRWDGRNECAGEATGFSFEADDCMAGKSLAMALYDRDGRRVASLGNIAVVRGVNSRQVNLPVGLSDGAYSLRLTYGNGSYWESDALGVRAPRFFSFSLGSAQVSPGDSVYLRWYASCNMNGTTTISMTTEQGTEVARVVRGATVYGVNGQSFLCNQVPGRYRFTVSVGSHSISSGMLTITEPTITRVWPAQSTVVLGVPFDVSWEATSGFGNTLGTLALYGADGKLLKTLAQNLALPEGVQTAAFTIHAADLPAGIPSAGCFLRLSAAGQTRDSALFSLVTEAGAWLSEIPAQLYQNQYLTLSYRQDLLFPDGRSGRFQIVDANGKVLQDTPNILPNRTGNQTVRVPIYATGISLQVRLLAADGTVMLRSSGALAAKASSMQVYLSVPGGVTWHWDGEPNTVRMRVYDAATNALMWEREQLQGHGWQAFANIQGKYQSGRQYRFEMVTTDRAVNFRHSQIFTYN